MKQNNIRGILAEHSIIPVCTFSNLEEVAPKIESLMNAGIKCIEITLRTPVSFDAIQMAKENFGAFFTVGVGTIINESQIERANALNVDFMVSPGLLDSLAIPFENSHTAFIPGVSTPSEIIKGIELGWDTFKFFPANLFGGIGALKTYAQVFPEIKFCPTGGINQESYQEYLALPNVISVGGSWMI